MLVWLTVSSLLLANPSPTAVPTREAVEAFAEQQMPPLLAKHRVAGGVITFVADGELLFAKGYGYRDLAAQLPVDPERTLFRVGSVSKLFVWTAVMQCVERGLIELDADVNRYLDGFAIPATFPEPITMAHLMAHTPGFEDQLLGLFAARAEENRSLDEAIHDIPKRVAPPGRFSSYSNYGAALAAYIVERVSGTPFDRYVEENIFAPLDMRSSSFAQPLPEPLASALSTGYEQRGEQLVPAGFEYISGLYPAGSLSSTAADMARFLLAHLEPGTPEGHPLLPPAALERMHRRSFGHDPRFSGMAHGFMQAPTGGGMMLYHGGDTIFFHSLAFIFPERRFGFFVSTNSSGGSLAVIELARAFLERFFAGETGQALAEGYAAPTDVGRFTGTYLPRRRSESDFTRLIALAMPVRVAPDTDGGLLITSFMYPEAVRFVQIGANLFRQRDGDDQVLFLDDDDAADERGAPVGAPGKTVGPDESERAGEGRASSLLLGLMPVITFSRPAFADQPLLAGLIAAFALLLLLTGLVLPPTGLLTLMRRWRQPAGEARLAARSGLLLVAVYIAFFVTFALSLKGGLLAVMSDSTARQIALLLPYAGAGLSVACLLFAGRAWRERFWGLASRLHYGALVLSTLAFFWLLAHWQVLA